MVENYVKIIGSTSGSKGQDVEWFSSDLQELAVNEQFGASKFRVTVAIGEAKHVWITLDSGTTWVKLNEGNNLTADALYVFDVPIRPSDNFNMKTDDATGCTVKICRVSEVSMEG